MPVGDEYITFVVYFGLVKVFEANAFTRFSLLLIYITNSLYGGYTDCHNENTTTIQVMVWWHQTPSYYLRPCWPRFMSPYAVLVGDSQWTHWSEEMILFPIYTSICNCAFKSLKHSRVISFWLIPEGLFGDKPTWFHIMGWCNQTPSHHLNRWPQWPISLCPMAPISCICDVWYPRFANVILLTSHHTLCFHGILKTLT